MANFTEFPILTSRYDAAVQFAIAAHRHQVRKDGTPYLMHLQAVAALVGEEGGTEAEIIAAWLHDYAEDIASQHNSVASGLQEIENHFGLEVAAIVTGCTELDQKIDWHTRKAAYIQQVAMGADSIVLVSLADKMHNSLSYLRELKQGKKVPKNPEKLWFYQELLSIYQRRFPEKYLVSRLEATLSELASFWT